MSVHNLIELCNNRKVWIQTHNFPDPDAIASSYALSQLLMNFGIESELCYDGTIDKLSSKKMLSQFDVKMFAYADIKQNMNEDDMIILVDCQKMASNTTDLIGDEVAVIDHHPTFIDIEYKYKDIKICGACSSIIASYYKDLGIKPTENVATALLYGLRMDTLSLSRGVTFFDVQMYEFLFPFVNNDIVAGLEINNLELPDLKSYAVGIENIKDYGVIGFSRLNFSCPDALLAMLSDFILTLVEIEVVIAYSKRERGYKFSIRNERPDVHAGALAKRALENMGDGGGHSTMAGGFVPYEKSPVSDEEFYDYIQEHFMKTIKEMYPHIV